MHKKHFTLIELIVVIAVLSVLASIVISNTSNIKNEAKQVAMAIDTRNIQTTVDMYKAKNKNSIPTLTEPTLESPAQIDFSKIVPKYLREKPKEGYYWLDYFGQVWSSSIDAPVGHVNESGVLSWTAPEGDSIIYRIYGVNSNTGATNSVIRLISEQKENFLDISSYSYDKFLISAIDFYGNETARVGNSYLGINKEQVVKPEVPSEPVNHAPTAIITVTPNSEIKTNTIVSFDFNNSIDEDGDMIIDSEWKNKLSKYPAGENTIELRVQDEHGLWSEWTSETINVVQYIPVDVNKYEKVLYVDSSIGNDTSGNGSESSPFKTIQKAIYSAPSNSAIYIKGENKPTSYLIIDKSVDFIGDGLSSKIKFSTTSAGSVNGSLLRFTNASDITVNFYMISFGFFDETIHSNTNGISSVYHSHAVVKPLTLNFYNCLFDSGRVIFDDSGTNQPINATFNNSLITNFYYPESGRNAYLELTNTVITKSSNKNYSGGADVENTSLLFVGTTYDSNYNITSDGWLNQGTGNNTDGSKSNIGLYGGIYSWQ